MCDSYGSAIAVFFFFKQKTAYEIYQCDWSSDVCSSDLDLDRLAGIRINISGCPNTCGQHMISDIGFFGKVDRKSVV